MKVLLVLLIAVLGNLALFFYLQTSNSPHIAEAPKKNSPIIVLKTP